MAIQGAINKLIGIAGAAAEATAQKQEQGLLAKQQYHEASADLKSLESESAGAEEALKNATKAVEATKNWDLKGSNSKMLEGKVAKRLSEQDAAKRAFDALADKIEAKKAMMSRAERIMKRTGTWGGVR